MTRTESTTKRMRRDENGDVALKAVGLARSPDAQATIDPKRVSDVWSSYDPGDGVSGRSDGPPAGDDHRQRTAEHRRRADR